MHEPTQESRDVARLVVHLAALEREVSELRQRLAKHSSNGEDRLVLFADIHQDKYTHDQKAASVMEETEERLRLAVESAGMGTWDYYAGAGEMKWSARTKEIFGMAALEDMNYQGFLSCVHPEDRLRVEDGMRRALDPQEASEYDVEHRVVRPNGEIRWVIARGKCFFAGEGPNRKWVWF